MKLTPLDIRKHEFGKRMRGYDPEEVRPFLEMLSQQWEELQDELRHARERVRDIENKVAHYEKVEVALQEALEAAKSSAQRTQAHAEERARLIIEEAELKAEQILREADQDRFKLRQDVSKLTHRHAEVTARLRHFLMAELEVLAQHEDERPIGFMKLIPARDKEAADARELSRTESVEPASAEARAQPVPSPIDVDEADQREAEESYQYSRQAVAGGTTYADIYARAADRDRDEPEQAQDDQQATSAEEEEPAWTLRSLVSDEQKEEPAEEPRMRSSERDHIQRILEDLD